MFNINKKRIILLTITTLLLTGLMTTTQAAKTKQGYTTGYTFDNEQIVIALGTNKGNQIRFRPNWELKMFFCIGKTTIPDADNIQLNNNQITLKGKGACAFKLTKK